MRVRSSDDEDGDIIDASEAIFLAEETTSTQPLQELDMAATKKLKSDPKAPAAKPKASKETVTKKDAGEPKSKGVFGPRAVPEGHTGLNVLAEKLGIKSAVARRKLRGIEGITKPEGQHGWYWKDGSKDLAAVTKALTPAAE